MDIEVLMGEPYFVPMNLIFMVNMNVIIVLFNGNLFLIVLFILMDYPMHIETIRTEFPILYF